MRRILVLTALTVAMTLPACDGGSSQPDVLREGRSIYGDTCSICHGSGGQGGIGPPLEAVVATWPDCSDQVEWISLGSDGWKAAHGDTYGANEQPVKGGMPAQGDQMTAEEIRLVAAFERVEYGGQDREAALTDCAVE